MKKLQGDLQDGLLAHYLAQARASDVNVEARLEREPFDVMEIISKKRIITAVRLRELLRYYPETGAFYWLAKGGNANAEAGEIAGRKSPLGYCQIWIDGNSYTLHRLAWLYVTGEWPANTIDHVNMDRSDNRWINLRAATRSQNYANTRVRSHSVSGIKGVRWFKQKEKWQARITVDGKGKNLGYFDTIEGAQSAYKTAAVKYFGEFSRTE